MTTVFQDADVEMPILSVALLSDDGTNGNDLNFHRDGGTIHHSKQPGKVSKFVKRQGVYFIQMKVNKSLINPHNQTPFARPA